MRATKTARPTLVGAMVCALTCASVTAAFAAAQVHVGDQLQITVYDHPELSRKVIVEADNTLSLPVGGTVNVNGLDTAQIADRVQRALDPYVDTPEVGVELVGRAPTILISGGPGGVLTYQPGENLMAALAAVPSGDGGASAKLPGLAGLQRSRVDLRRVGIERNGHSLGVFDGLELSARGEGGPLLQPGDTLVLSDKPIAVRVEGAVAFPGYAHVSADQPLSDAIEQVGGVLPTAASAQVRLERDAQTQTIALGDSILSEPARAGDVLIVPTAPRVSVDGFVDKPGLVTLSTNFSLLNALYQAGGPTKRGDLTQVLVIHDGVSNHYNLSNISHGTPTENVTLKDGDLVFVPESRKIDYTAFFQTLLPFAYLFPRF